MENDLPELKKDNQNIVSYIIIGLLVISIILSFVQMKKIDSMQRVINHLTNSVDDMKPTKKPIIIY